MAEIVTVKERFDAEPLLKAVERAYAYSVGLDDLDSIRRCQVAEHSSPMTKLYGEAWEIVQEVRAAEREEEFDADYANVSLDEFNERFGIATEGVDRV